MSNYRKESVSVVAVARVTARTAVGAPEGQKHAIVAQARGRSGKYGEHFYRIFTAISDVSNPGKWHPICGNHTEFMVSDLKDLARQLETLPEGER